MKRREIQRKLPEIVEFSGVEAFLDTPVKRYSSGMYVRLAFSVAAHLEPEILLVDEVLAVGDAEFQAPLPRADGGLRRDRPDGVVRLAQHAGGGAALRPRDPDGARPRRSGRPARGRRRALPADVGGRRVEPDVADSRRAGRRARPAAVGADRRTRTGRPSTTSTSASRSESSSSSACSRTGQPVLPKIKLVADGRIAFNAMDVDPRWHDPSRPGEYVATAWIPANS